MTRFLWDENTSQYILRAIRRLRRDVDVVTVQEIDLAGAPDSVVLERAMADGRVLVTHDRATIPGVVVIRSNTISIGDIARGLIFLADAAVPGDWQNPIFMG